MSAPLYRRRFRPNRYRERLVARGAASAFYDGYPFESRRIMIEDLDRAVLTRDIPEKKLKAGDVGAVVMVCKNGDAVEVEFMTLDGGAFALETLMAADVRPARGVEIAHAREVA